MPPKHKDIDLYCSIDGKCFMPLTDMQKIQEFSVDDEKTMEFPVDTKMSTGELTLEFKVPFAYWYHLRKCLFNNWRKMHGLPMISKKRAKNGI